MEEIWKPIAGYEGLYDVSNLGRVRSHDRYSLRKGGFKALLKGKVLKPNLGTKGHWAVNLWIDGSYKTKPIHRLVALAFIPNPDNFPVVRHLNDVKSDNRASNLAWGTYSDNAKDAIRNGVKYGDNHLKTSCPSGHSYAGKNLYIAPDGRRACRTCKRDHWRRKNWSGYTPEVVTNEGDS